MNASVATDTAGIERNAASAALLARLMHYGGDVLSAGSTEKAAQIIVRRLNELMPLQRALLVQLKPKLRLLTTNSGHHDLRNGKLLTDIKKLSREHRGVELGEHSSDQAQTLWLPVAWDNKQARYALCLQRSSPWSDSEKTLLLRLRPFLRSGLLQHQSQKKSSWRKPLSAVVGLIATAVLLAWPVQQSFVAQAEVVASTPATFYAPLNAVVERVYVTPGAEVLPGTLLIKLEDQLLLQQVDEARENVAVELAELSRLESAGLSDSSARANLPVQRLKVTKAQAALDYQRTLLSRTNITASIGGVVSMASVASLEGSAVQLGDPLLTIADPNQSELLLQVPVKDRGLFRADADVKLRLDSNPLNVLNAKTTRVSYDVSRNSDEQPVVEARAEFSDDQRIAAGQRGSARVYGEDTRLGWQLLRKPALTLLDTFGY